MGLETQNTKKLDEMIAPHLKGLDVLADVWKEVAEEKAAKKRVKAKELIAKALEIRDQMEDADRQYQQQKAKFEKTLGGLLGQIDAMMKGKPAPVEGEPAAEAPAGA